jgi:hypothetical protein
MRTLENAARRWGFYRVAGCDEVGRGCLAGPVVAGAVILDPGRHIPGLADSKTITSLERERLYDVITTRALAWSVAALQPTEIDAINIHRASLEAMRRALTAIAPLPDLVLVDAFRIPDLYFAQRAVLPTDSGETETEDVLAEFVKLLDSRLGRFILVLGDFGTGKTFLLRELARKIGLERNAMVPVLVEMRALEKASTLDALIAQHFALAGMEQIDLKAFKHAFGEQFRLRLVEIRSFRYQRGGRVEQQHVAAVVGMDAQADGDDFLRYDWHGGFPVVAWFGCRQALRASDALACRRSLAERGVAAGPEPAASAALPIGEGGRPGVSGRRVEPFPGAGRIPAFQATARGTNRLSG